MTLAVLTKLEDAFRIGLSDRKACEYAGISPMTLYRYQEKYPEYSERKEGLKLLPTIKAQSTIVENLGNVAVAQWWLTKKDPEFSDKPVIGTVIHEHRITPALQNAVAAYRNTRNAEIRAEIKRRAELERATQAIPVISTVVVEKQTA